MSDENDVASVGGNLGYFQFGENSAACQFEFRARANIRQKRKSPARRTVAFIRE